MIYPFGLDQPRDSDLAPAPQPVPLPGPGWHSLGEEDFKYADQHGLDELVATRAGRCPGEASMPEHVLPRQ